MPGRKRKPTTKDGRGGARPGAGRPPAVKEEARLCQMLKDIRKWEEETGKTINDELLRLFFRGKKVTVREKIAIAKHFNECTVPKQIKEVVEEESCGPTIIPHEYIDRIEELPKELYRGPIGLPEMLPDPADLIPINGTKNNDNTAE